MEIQATLSQKSEGRRLAIVLSPKALAKLQSGEEISVESSDADDFQEVITERDAYGELLAIVKISISVDRELIEE